MANLNFDDKTLIALICGTSAQRNEALHILFCDNSLRGIVINHVRQHGGNDEDGKDIFQDAMITFDENIRGGRFEAKSALRTYFVGIAKGQWFNKYRQRKNHNIELQPTHYDEAIPSVEAEIISEERKSLIEQALSQIGERCKSILDMYKLSYNYQEVAATFGFSSPEMAKKESYRCRIRFRDYVKNQPHLFELFKSMI